MRILCDENITSVLMDLMHSFNIEAVHISDLRLKGIADAEVVELAQSEERVLLSEDKHCFRLLKAMRKSYGMIYLRTSYKYQPIVCEQRF